MVHKAAKQETDGEQYLKLNKINLIYGAISNKGVRLWQSQDVRTVISMIQKRTTPAHGVLFRRETLMEQGGLFLKQLPFPIRGLP
jgi:hypothetical protein